MTKRFRKGDLVEVRWSDPAGAINAEQKGFTLAPCVTRGTVLDRKGKTLRLWHSRYADDVGDYTALHTGCVDDWRVLVRREELGK